LTRRRAIGARLDRPLLGLGAIALAVLALSGQLPGSGAVSRATPGSGEPTPQTDASIPARGVVMMGSSPLDAADETWGIGTIGSEGNPSWVTVRYRASGGWSLGPASLNDSGAPLSGFEPDRNALLAGQMAPHGGGVLLGTVPKEPGGESTQRRQALLVRDPNKDQGAFREAPPVPEEGEGALLKPGESLYDEHRAPLTAPLDEESGAAGALVVPVKKSLIGAEDGVLHWDGAHWTRESIEIPEESREGFRVLAIAASSPSNAWLLARLPSPAGAVALFRRDPAGLKPRWKPVAPAPKEAFGAPLRVNGEPVTVTGTGASDPQILTVTDEGVWVDGERADISERLTLFFTPKREGEGESEQYGGEAHSWCDAPEGSPPCDGALPEALPRGPSRSFAWADPANPHGFGQRVITGLSDGVSLRLDGATFTRVLALGASPAEDVGGSLGAAFANPREGWLGNRTLPVHLTLAPAPNRLTPYPVPFRRALLAVAPQPAAPVGALSSQALAVGDRGEIGRFIPGQGWLPESLIGINGRPARPRLRGVAWPTPGRAYAVGTLDSQGDSQMWLWRGETGLWEPDPAMPLNFRGNLLGIAFDPSNPSRGYAVGQQGVLLRYGKSWSQDALPPEVAGATFTSIAFAGSQAIVAYRLAHLQGGARFYTGGVIVNDGAGWSGDPTAAKALGGDVPWAVAGLPDGAAAVSASGATGILILERNSPSAAWQPTPAPYPGLDFEEPGSLALFREGGALRVVGSGGVPRNATLLEIDTAPPPPVGFPPNLVNSYPLASSGAVVRQTALGWSDEQHDRNSAREPPGEWKAYDAVFQPDPVSAVLIDPTGALGWAVGGFVDESNEGLDTAGVARYPADGVAPPGFSSAPVLVLTPTEKAAFEKQATFAIAGNGQCLTPCANRANAGVGPDVWLATALERSARIPGVRGFIDTGPRVTTGIGHGLFPVAYEREFNRYAQVLASSSLPAFAAAAPSDRGPGNECLFEEAFSGFPAPFGSGPAAPGLTPSQGGRSVEECKSAGSQSGYYAMDSSGPVGSVRVIVLDDSTEVGSVQLAWLAQKLQEAKGNNEPAIAVGNAEINAHQAIAATLVHGGASAYFYDSPEQNVQLPLTVGTESIPAFGSGTLGYVSSVAAEATNFKGHSGFLLAQVAVAARSPSTNRAPVTVRLIPDIGELALEAKDGVLLRRSKAALFSALARRPRSGGRAQRESDTNESAVYIPIPANCVGTGCASAIPPEYTFSSSHPDVGDFVQPNLASTDPHSVLLGTNEKPIHDPQSGLFCAYNAGTTIVTISAGGLSASVPVTIQAGSVRRPCGTQPLKELPTQPAPLPAPPPAPAPAPTPAPATAPPPVPPPPTPAAVTPPAPRALPALSQPFFALHGVSSSLVAAPSPPVPTPARPTPPSGTSAVSQPVEAAEKEEEKEEATESVSNQAAAYHPHEQEPPTAYILGIVVLAAFAGSSVRRRPRRGRRELRVAPATITGMRAQRRLDGRDRRAR